MHLGLLTADPAYREANREARAEFESFRSEFGGSGLAAKLLPRGERKKALIHHVTIPYAKLEAILEKAVQAAGFECIPVGARTHDFLRYDWLVGNEAGYLLRDFDTAGDPEWVKQQMPRLVTARDWLNLRYDGVRVGQFVLASSLREFRVGQLDFADPKVQSVLASRLNGSVSCTIAGTRLLDEVKPDCVVLMDRGYSGAGELFDLAVQRGLNTITWNFGYKSDRLALKRYNKTNDRDHPLCPSRDAWDRMLSLPRSRSYGEEVRQELFGCYNSEDWFSAVGTQFDKRILSREATLRELRLSEDKKVAVIFPHILWDGSFFYGEDLFQDYTEWLVETIKAACANDRLQWVVKLHPAHIVKARRDNHNEKPAELVALEGIIDELPPHVKLVRPETPISTYSLFQIADYVITVRGTVGIEAALFGVPVITAGTGRYDSRGFTFDSRTKDEYLTRLATLETSPPMTADQIELAEKYAYYVFLGRPLRLSCASLEYARDGKASPILTVRCQTPDQWLASPDMISLIDWIRDATAEDFVGAPVSPPGSTEIERHHSRGAGLKQLAGSDEVVTSMRT